MKRVIIVISILIVGFVSIPQKATFDIQNTDRVRECKTNIWHSYTVIGQKIHLPKGELFTPDLVKPVELYFPFCIPTYFNVLKYNIGI